MSKDYTLEQYIHEISSDSNTYYAQLTSSLNSMGVNLAAPENMSADEFFHNVVELIIMWIIKLQNETDKPETIFLTGLKQAYDKHKSSDFVEHNADIEKIFDNKISPQLTQHVSLIVGSTAHLFEIKEYTRTYKLLNSSEKLRKICNKEVVFISQLLSSFFWIMQYYGVKSKRIGVNYIDEIYTELFNIGKLVKFKV